MRLELSQKLKLLLKEARLIKKFEFHKTKFLLLKIICIFLFVPFTGPLLHELGHYIVAKFNGFGASNSLLLYII